MREALFGKLVVDAVVARPVLEAGTEAVRGGVDVGARNAAAMAWLPIGPPSRPWNTYLLPLRSSAAPTTATA